TGRQIAERPRSGLDALSARRPLSREGSRHTSLQMAAWQGCEARKFSSASEPAWLESFHRSMTTVVGKCWQDQSRGPAPCSAPLVTDFISAGVAGSKCAVPLGKPPADLIVPSALE